MNKEDNYVKNRLLDLADITYSKNIYAYSDFLNLNEINIFYMLVIWMAYTNKVNVDEDRYITNEQYLLENAIYEMDNLRDGYIDDFVECVLHTCSRCEEIDYEKQ